MNHFDRAGFRAGTLAALAVIALTYAGSRQLMYFDWVLMPYAIGTVFASFAVAYRFAVWAQRPPTLMYLKRGWQTFLRREKNALLLGTRFVENFVLQKFIAGRSAERWLMHLCLSWGGLLAFALTFPLVFGWIHFETSAADLHTYQLFVLGMRVQEFSVDSLLAFLLFNALNLSAVLVLVGIALSLHRRLTEPGALALQQFSQDLFPLLVLFTVATTGLGLTVSARWLHGHGFSFIALTHAATVTAL